MLPTSITDAIEALSDLPGIGSRSAERLIFSLLKNNTGLDQKIARTLGNLKTNIKECKNCSHLCEEERCKICTNPGRDRRIICIVENPLDLIALERTHEFRGQYHVLHGVISPMNKVRPGDLRIPSLLKRIKESDEIEEILLATSGNVEGDATALYLTENIKKFFPGKISRLARGIPTGGDLDYLDIGTLSRAISDRREF